MAYLKRHLRRMSTTAAWLDVCCHAVTLHSHHSPLFRTHQHPRTQQPGFFLAAAPPSGGSHKCIFGGGRVVLHNYTFLVAGSSFPSNDCYKVLIHVYMFLLGGSCDDYGCPRLSFIHFLENRMPYAPPQGVFSLLPSLAFTHFFGQSSFQVGFVRIYTHDRPP